MMVRSPSPWPSASACHILACVTARAKKVLDEALALPSDERRRVAEALLDSVGEESEHEIDPAWRDEVLRRIGEVQRGEVKPEPWSEVRRQIREALAR